MSDLQNQTPANTYKGLLQVDDYTNGVDSTAKFVSDGEGTNSALSISESKVGVGTVSPGGKLEVFTESDDTGIAYGNLVGGLLLNNKSDVAGAGPKLIFYNTSDTGSGAPSALIGLQRVTDGVSAGSNEGDLVFFTRGTIDPEERMRIDSDGNCGIGATNPSANLHVLKDMGSTNVDGSFTLQKTAYTRSSSHPESSGQSMTHKLHELSYSGDFTTSGNNHLNDTIIGLDVNLDTNAGGQYAALFNGGNIGIGTESPSAPLEVASTTGGVIMPRMTTTQRDAISSPTDGEMIYNTTTNKFQGRANGAWVDFH